MINSDRENAKHKTNFPVLSVRFRSFLERQVDWILWLVAGLFYLPLHLGLPALWLFYRLLDGPQAVRQRLMGRFLREGVVLLALTLALAAWIWWRQWPVGWLVLELLLASLLPFWRAWRLSGGMPTA